MANQSFIYNSDAENPNVNNPFTVERSALIRAAGLTECVDIYMAVGVCMDCANDIKWEPITKCGGKLSLCPDNNFLVIGVPGKYALGDPNTGPLTLLGDVNITKEEGVTPNQVTSLACPEGCTDLPSGIQTVWPSN
jgi:hypothetical protein